MKEPMRVLLWCTVVATLAAIPTLDTAGQKAKGPLAPFSIAITGPTEAKAGSEIEIRVTMTNTSDHDIDAGSFFVDGVDTAYKYEVRDGKGNLAEKKVKQLAGSIRMETLKPGENTEEGTLVSRVCNMSRADRYEIQLSRAISNDAKQGVVKSNKITITVDE